VVAEDAPGTIGRRRHHHVVRLEVGVRTRLFSKSLEASNDITVNHRLGGVAPPAVSTWRVGTLGTLDLVVACVAVDLVNGPTCLWLGLDPDQ
jgi:hypothetical protein